MDRGCLILMDSKVIYFDMPANYIFFFSSIKVATAAANGDKKTGEWVAKAVEKLGIGGLFFVDVSCLFYL